MAQDLGFSLVFLKGAVTAAAAARNRRDVERAKRRAAAILLSLAPRKPGEERELPMRCASGASAALSLSLGLFRGSLELRVSPEGCVSVARAARGAGKAARPRIPAERERQALEEDRTFLEVLFLSSFQGDAAVSLSASAPWSDLKVGLFMALVENGIGPAAPGELGSRTVRSVLDALAFESYSVPSGGRLRDRLAVFFYRRNSGKGPVPVKRSQSLSDLLQRLRDPREFAEAWLAYLYFARSLKEMRPVDPGPALKAAAEQGSGGKEALAAAESLAAGVKRFIETSVAGSFQDSIVKDVKEAMRRSSGEAYQAYERILGLLDRKAWEDIFQTMRSMVDKAYLSRSRDYYLFYRIFAFSFFEAAYPGPYRQSVNETERKASLLRFQYVSTYLNRLIVTQDLYREGPGPKGLVQTARNIFYFCLGLFALGGAIQLLMDLLPPLRGVSLLALTGQAYSAAAEWTYRAVTGFAASGPGFFTQTILAFALVLFLFIPYFLYRSASSAIARLVSGLRARHRLFFVLANCLAFFLTLNFFAEGFAWVFSSGYRDDLLLVTNRASSEVMRDDPFMERFLSKQGFFASYRVRRADLRELNEAIQAGASDKLLGKPIGDFERVIFAAAPYVQGAGMRYEAAMYDLNPALNALTTAWAGAAGRDLEIAFFYPFSQEAPTAFKRLPILDRLEVRSCMSEYGAIGLAYTPKAMPWGAAAAEVFGLMREDDEGFAEILKKLLSIKNVKERKALTEVSFNIDYYYALPGTPAAKAPEAAGPLQPLISVNYLAGPKDPGMAAFLYELEDGDLKTGAGLGAAGSLRILSLDQKYLKMDSKLGSIMARNFFIPDDRPASPWGLDPRTTFFVSQAFLLLAGAGLMSLIGYSTRRQRLAMLGSIVLAQAPLVFLLTPGMGGLFKPGLESLWGASPAVPMLAFMMGLFLFNLFQVLGLGKDGQIRLLLWTAPAAQILFWVLGAFIIPSPLAVADFLDGRWGLLIQSVLTGAVGVASAAFFSFKFRAR